MAELVDAHASGACSRKGMGVRVSPRAQIFASWGLRAYDRVIDTDRIVELQKTITRADLQNALDVFTSTQPTTIVIGDLS